MRNSVVDEEGIRPHDWFRLVLCVPLRPLTQLVRVPLAVENYQSDL